MYTTEVVIWVLLADYLGVALPVLQLLCEQQVVLVGKAPPHVAVGGKPGDNVLPVEVVLLRRHGLEAPAVVGVHDDDIRLYAALLEL